MDLPDRCPLPAGSIVLMNICVCRGVAFVQDDGIAAGDDAEFLAAIAVRPSCMRTIAFTLVYTSHLS